MCDEHPGITNVQRAGIIESITLDEGYTVAGLAMRFMCDVADVEEIMEEEGFVDCISCGCVVDSANADERSYCNECGYDYDEDYFEGEDDE